VIGELRRFLLRLWNAARPGVGDRELEREIAAHVALIEEAHRRHGASPDEARLAAHRAIGSVALTKDRHRDARSFRWIDDLIRDLRYAVRTLIRFPGFTVVVLVTLALGIGANTAIFSVVHSVLLTPLPYQDAGQIVRVWENVPGSEIGDGKGPDRRYGAMDLRDLLEASRRSRTITHLANFSYAQVNATIGSDTTRLEGFGVSGDFFALLAVQPLLGRTIAADDAIAGRDRVVVLSYETWQRFGGSPGIVGRRITFGGDPTSPFTGGIVAAAAYTVIGVMPWGFHFPYDNARFWVARVQTPAADGRVIRRETVARLARGATTDVAAAELAAIRGISSGRTKPTLSDGVGAAARGTNAARPGAPPRYELFRIHDELTAPVRPALVALSAAVAIVLLIACVNVANLLLARGLSRQRELAVRSAIGAGTGRLVRQLLAESVLLSAAGGAGGVALAAAGVRMFRSLGTTLGRADLGNAVVFPRLADVTVDATVLAYAAALSLVTGVLFGLLPAWRHARSVSVLTLREQTASSRTRLKNVLVVAEVGMATLLLIDGGLLISSFVRLATIDPGFDPSHLLTFQVGITRGDQLAFAESLVERLKALPGVVSVGYGRQLPMVDLQDSLRLTIRRDGVDQTLDEFPDIRLVSRDYLRTLGVPILAGRGLAERDAEGQPPVILVNDALVRRNFQGVAPIGQTIVLGPVAHRFPLEIVGVVGNIRQFGLDRPAESQYFMDMRQVSTDPALRMPPLFPVGAYYLVRVAGDPGAIVGNIRSIVRQLDPAAPLDRIATMEQIVANSMTVPRLYAVLAAIFSTIALALAIVGLYGVVSYNVTQRTREIGVRMALGAQARQVMQLVLRESGVLVLIGLAIGLVAAIFGTRYLDTLLFGLEPLDATTFVAVLVLFPTVALIASYVPARRATSIDPLEALRCE
jgi:predicted permease